MEQNNNIKAINNQVIESISFRKLFKGIVKSFLKLNLEWVIF